MVAKRRRLRPPDAAKNRAIATADGSTVAPFGFRHGLDDLSQGADIRSHPG